MGYVSIIFGNEHIDIIAVTLGDIAIESLCQRQPFNHFDRDVGGFKTLQNTGCCQELTLATINILSIFLF